MAILSGVSDVKTEQKEVRDSQAALLLRNAYGNRRTPNKTVIVLANGNVTLSAILDMDYAFQFTIEQWNEIVEFVDGQLLQAFEDEIDKRAAQWPDWSKIDSRYQYWAVDSDGNSYAFEERPRISENVWLPDGKPFEDTGFVELPVGIDWRTTLRIRPQGL